MCRGRRYWSHTSQEQFGWRVPTMVSVLLQSTNSVSAWYCFGYQALWEKMRWWIVLWRDDKCMSIICGVRSIHLWKHMNMKDESDKQIRWIESYNTSLKHILHTNDFDVPQHRSVFAWSTSTTQLSIVGSFVRATTLYIYMLLFLQGWWSLHVHVIRVVWKRSVTMN